LEDNPESKLRVKKRMPTEPNKRLKQDIESITKEDFVSFMEKTRLKLCLAQNLASSSS